MGALIFGAAGDLRFWQGWMFLAVFFAASVIITQYLIANDPALLQRRVKGGPTEETEPTQRLIMVFMSVGFVALIVVPALDHRFGWSQAPAIAALAGDALIAVGFCVIFLVFRANSFASSTIGVAEGQTLVSTGPYAVVRLAPESPIPDWATKGEFTSITRTSDELSIVCPLYNIPKDVSPGPRWICLKLEGPFPFSQTGVLLSFIAPLSNNAIPIFAISTYDTDYVLVQEQFSGVTLDILREAGHRLLS